VRDQLETETSPRGRGPTWAYSDSDLLLLTLVERGKACCRRLKQRACFLLSFTSSPGKYTVSLCCAQSPPYRLGISRNPCLPSGLGLRIYPPTGFQCSSHQSSMIPAHSKPNNTMHPPHLTSATPLLVSPPSRCPADTRINLPRPRTQN